MSLVQFRHVDFAYTPTARPRAHPFRLDGVTFDIEAGEILGVVGPNSAGKTTVIRLVSRVVAPHRGTILLEGRPLAALSRAVIAQHVAVIAQARPTGGPFTVGELVLMGRYPHAPHRFFENPDDRARAQAAMDAAGVGDLAGLTLGELSGGESQRVMLARALCQEPRLLVLDEPTNHLDLRHQVELVSLLRRLQQRRSLTVLVVSHDLSFAAEVADRLLLLNAGRIERIGPPEAVLDDAVLSHVYQCPVVADKHPTTGRRVVHIAWPDRMPSPATDPPPATLSVAPVP